MILLILWVPLSLLAAAAVPSKLLNARVAKVRSVADKLGWAGFTSSVLCLGLWQLTNQGSLTATLTEAGILGLRLDTLSLVMTSLVTFVGAVVLRFSKNYLAGDANQGHFFKWMMVTLGAVLSLCLSPGLVQFWLSWVICSLGLHQLLIYFPDRLGTLLSGRKKFIVSRLGDLCLIIAFVGIMNAFGTQSFDALFAQVTDNPALITANAWVSWFIIAGAALKSAQFPFHTWLPDTMGTPTPVSALMHAGIINAGGYLVIRMSPLLVHTPAALHALALIGAITLAGASLVMLTQTSIKRNLAYSTIAQMGFMLLQCGLGAFSLATLHLVAHSLYKAHAFLSSGSTVANIKRLEPGATKTLSLFSLGGFAAISFALVIVFLVLLGMNISEKPGLIVLGTVLAVALTQFLVAHMGQNNSFGGIMKSTLLAGGLVGLYLALAQISIVLFSSLLPVATNVDIAFQTILALAIASFLLTTIYMVHNPSKLTSSPLAQALYVHALNGFYLNTIANRLARAIGIVPAGR